MAVGLWHWKIAHYKILLGFSEENDRTKDFIAFAIKENRIRLRANKVAVYSAISVFLVIFLLKVA